MLALTRNSPFNPKARRTQWNKTEIKRWNCFSLISLFFNTVKLFQCFSFSDVRTFEIKLRPSAVLFYFRFISPCATRLRCARQSLSRNMLLVRWWRLTRSATTQAAPTILHRKRRSVFDDEFDRTWQDDGGPVGRRGVSVGAVWPLHR